MHCTQLKILLTHIINGVFMNKYFYAFVCSSALLTLAGCGKEEAKQEMSAEQTEVAAVATEVKAADMPVTEAQAAPAAEQTELSKF